jgi:hypothetical protein
MLRLSGLRNSKGIITRLFLVPLQDPHCLADLHPRAPGRRGHRHGNLQTHKVELDPIIERKSADRVLNSLAAVGSAKVILAASPRIARTEPSYSSSARPVPQMSTDRKASSARQTSASVSESSHYKREDRTGQFRYHSLGVCENLRQLYETARNNPEAVFPRCLMAV